MGNVGEWLEYEDIQAETKLEDCASSGSGDEERGSWHEIYEGWRCRMDPNGEKEVEKECRSEDGDDSGILKY